MKNYSLVMCFTNKEECEKIYSAALPLEPEYVLWFDNSRLIEIFKIGSNLFSVYKDHITYSREHTISEFEFSAISWYIETEED